jgi:hypothetical protein
MFVGVLGGVAACASLLGIDSPSDRGGAKADSEAAPPDAEDVLGPDVDAARPDARDANDGGLQDDSSGESAAGVQCGDSPCLSPFACCYASPLSPMGCRPATDCMISAGNPVQCDGPEDCGPGQICCVNAPPVGGFTALCLTEVDCKGPVACHSKSANCDCTMPAGPCLPVKTCDGRCM